MGPLNHCMVSTRVGGVLRTLVEERHCFMFDELTGAGPLFLHRGRQQQHASPTHRRVSQTHADTKLQSNTKRMNTFTTTHEHNNHSECVNNDLGNHGRGSLTWVHFPQCDYTTTHYCKIPSATPSQVQHCGDLLYLHYMYTTVSPKVWMVFHCSSHNICCRATQHTALGYTQHC